MTKKIEKTIEALRKPAPAFENLADSVRETVAGIIEEQADKIKEMEKQIEVHKEFEKHMQKETEGLGIRIDGVLQK